MVSRSLLAVCALAYMAGTLGGARRMDFEDKPAVTIGQREEQAGASP